MTVRLRGHSAEEMLRLAAASEQGWMPRGEELGSSTYRKVHNWLLKEEYLTRLLLKDGSHERLPGFEASRAALLWRRFAGRRIRGSCVADALRVKTHLRAFYPQLQTPAVTKVLIGDDGQLHHKLETEISVRSQVSALTCPAAPRLLRHSLDVAHPWYAEELIAGRTATADDARLISDNLVPGLFRMYERFGIVTRKPASVLRPNALQMLESAMSRVKWELRWEPKARFLERIAGLSRSAARLPCSTTHGDLSPTNLLITRERKLFVIDWEDTALRPIMFDLVRLILRFPGVEQAARTGLSAVRSPETVLSFEEQHVMALIAWVLVWEHRGAQRKHLQHRLTPFFAAANRILLVTPAQAGAV